MSKKFLIFIVEGPHDEDEIGAILDTPRFADLAQKYDFRFIKTKGDITSDDKVKSVRGELTKYVIDFRRRGGPYPNIRLDDIQEVVQIVDLDGTFIPLDNIVKGEVMTYQYTDDSIIAKDADKGRHRNKQKAERIRQLVFDTDKIDNIPYSIYFVSCDMEHVLFNIRKPDREQKNQLSEFFMEECKRNPQALDSSVFLPGVAAEGDYEESWIDIMQPSFDSLLRHTNLNVFLSDRARNEK